MNIRAVTYGQLDGAPSRETITCASADTDVAAGGAIPDGTHVLAVSVTDLCFLAFGSVTDGTHGMPVSGDALLTIRAGQGDNTLHAQSPTAGAKVYVSYLKQ